MPKANEGEVQVAPSIPVAPPTAPTAPAMPGLPPLPGLSPAPVAAAPTPPPTAEIPSAPAAPNIAELQAQLAAAQAAAAPAPVAAAPPVAPPVALAPAITSPVVQVPQVELTMTPAPDAQIQNFQAVPAPAPTVSPAPIPATPVTAAPQLNLGAQMSAMATPGGGGVDLLKNYDLSQVQTNNFRLLPADQPFYEGRITKAELGKSSTGFPQIKLSIKTCYPTMYGGVTINDYVTVMPQTMWKYKSLLEATGLLSPDGARFAGNSMADFVGKIVQFQIKHEPYNGETRNKMAGGYAIATMTEEIAHQPVAAGVPGGVPNVNWG